MEVKRIEYTSYNDKTVIGRAYDKNNRIIAEAEANCHPEDKFDFTYGACLCQTRLVTAINQIIKKTGWLKCVGPSTHAFSNGKLYKRILSSDGNYYMVNNHGELDNEYFDKNPAWFVKPDPRDFLRNGVVGMTADNVTFVVVNDCIMYEDGGYDHLKDIDTNLRYTGEDEDDTFGINLVIKPSGPCGFDYIRSMCAQSHDNSSGYWGEVLWQR